MQRWQTESGSRQSIENQRELPDATFIKFQILSNTTSRLRSILGLRPQSNRFIDYTVALCSGHSGAANFKTELEDVGIVAQRSH